MDAHDRMDPNKMKGGRKPQNFQGEVVEEEALSADLNYSMSQDPPSDHHHMQRQSHQRRRQMRRQDSPNDYLGAAPQSTTFVDPDAGSTSNELIFESGAQQYSNNNWLD